MTTPTAPPIVADFKTALGSLRADGSYPTYGHFGEVKTVAEMRSLLGDQAEWDDYARLAKALASEHAGMGERASDKRRSDYLQSEGEDALRLAQAAYNRQADERRMELRGLQNGGLIPTGVRSDYREQTHRAGASINYEERTYSAGKSAPGARDRDPVNYFSDLYHYQMSGDPQARGRLEQHAREAEQNGEFGNQQRANTTGTFAGLVVPQYLVDEAALLARAGRPFANSLNSQQIPEQGMTFLIPKAATGASAAIQAVENTSVSSTDESWNNITVQVGTVAGQADVSRQSLDRGMPNLDRLVYSDIAGAYGVAVDQQLISGSGSSGQTLGVLNTASIGQATAYTAALGTSVAPLYAKLNGANATIAGTRFLPADHALLHPRRSAWLSNQFDSQGRPLVLPESAHPVNEVGTVNAGLGPVGRLLNLDLIADASVPTAVGSGPEDLVIVYRAADLLFWEDGDGLPRELRFEQTLGQQLTVKLVSYNYIAFTAARYPQSVVVIGGNSAAGFGQIAPTF